MKINDNLQQNNEIFIIPPINIRETKDEIIVEAEMPGIDRNHLEILTNGEELEITGRRKKEENDWGESAWSEIPTHHFRRVFSLDDRVNPSAIQASLNNGILTLKLTKAEEIKPRQIDIQFN